MAEKEKEEEVWEIKQDSVSVCPHACVTRLLRDFHTGQSWSANRNTGPFCYVFFFFLKQLKKQGKTNEKQINKPNQWNNGIQTPTGKRLGSQSKHEAGPAYGQEEVSGLQQQEPREQAAAGAAGQRGRWACAPEAGGASAP